MGQQASGESQQPVSTQQAKTPTTSLQSLTQSEIHAYFTKSCLSQFKRIELQSLSKTFHSIPEDSELDEEQFTQALGLPMTQPTLTKLIFRMFRVLALFPFINQPYRETVSKSELLRVLVLLNAAKFRKLTGQESVSQELLLFLALTVKTYQSDQEKQVMEKTYDVLVDSNKGGGIEWGSFQPVLNLDGLDITSLSVTTSDLLNFLAFLFILTSHNPIEDTLSSLPWPNFSSYKMSALGLVKSMNLEITNDNFKVSKISYDDYQRTLKDCAPFILESLPHFTETYLYDHFPSSFTSNGPISEEIPLESSKDILDPAIAAQISSMLPASQWRTQLQKLYIGSESGYSQRSFESKVFNWNSPTILILKGSRIPEHSKNLRYKSFEEEYPQFNHPLQPNQSCNDTICYAVYVENPWRVTNKDTFGSKGTTILQLSPHQRIFKVESLKDIIYFNTQGGGISFGSPQPLLKSHVKKYIPGRVSLLIEPSMEFAIFRHLGPGVTFRSPDHRLTFLEYEDRIQLKEIAVWGCGGTKEIEEQNKKWQWEQAEAQRRRYLNKDSFNEDRALLEMAGIVGQFNPMGGSAS